MKIKPLGHYVLIVMEAVEKKTASGIIIPDKVTSVEQDATDVGYVRAFGPTSYAGWPGCDVEGKEPHECWGLNVGDKVEYRKYEGKKVSAAGFENFRFISDSHIIGAHEND